MGWNFSAPQNEWNRLAHDAPGVSLSVPYFEITSPADTALWTQGDWVRIIWSSFHHNFNTVTVALFTRKGQKVRTIAHSADDNGEIGWLVDIPTFFSVDTLFELRMS